MFTIRNVGGAALFLAGTTWLWLTPAFAGRGVSTEGILWVVTQVLCFATIAGFCVAAWGLFARASWWETVALWSAVLGVATLVPYWFAAARGGESVGASAWSALVHVLIAAGVLAMLLVPQLEHWVDQRVMTG